MSARHFIRPLRTVGDRAGKRTRLVAGVIVLALILSLPAVATADHDGSSFSLEFRYGSPPACPVYYDPWVTEFVEYYGCAPVVVERYRAVGYPAEDLAVAVYISHYSGVSLATIIDWRFRGLGWYDISRRCDLAPVVFMTPLNSPYDVCGVYARPYARWHERPGNRWTFSDREARELVMLRFATARYHRDPRWVMHERAAGRSWNECARASWNDKRGHRDRDGCNRPGQWAQNDRHRDDRDHDFDQNRDGRKVSYRGNAKKWKHQG